LFKVNFIFTIDSELNLEIQISGGLKGRRFFFLFEKYAKIFLDWKSLSRATCS